MNIIWDIYNVKRQTETGMVFKVIYLVKAKKSGYSETYNGKLELEPTNSEDFIPFRELNKGIILDWVKSELGETVVSEIENDLIEKLNLRLSKLDKSVSNGLPQGTKIPKFKSLR